MPRAPTPNDILHLSRRLYGAHGVDRTGRMIRAYDPPTDQLPRAGASVTHLLGLLARIVLGIDVDEVPRPVGADLDNGVFVNEDMMRHTRGECDEAPRGQGLRLAVI